MSRVNKIVLWMIGVLFVLSCVGVSLAKESSKAKGAASGGGASMDAKLEAEKRAREALNGTQWVLELAPMSGEKEKRPTQDTVRFQGGTITSEKLSSEGFPTTNFSITIGGDGVTVWETMQTAKDNTVIFWRGELHGETMRGLLSRHAASGAVTDWSFSGRLKPAVPENKPAVEEPKAAAPSKPAQPAPASKSKKK